MIRYFKYCAQFLPACIVSLAVIGAPLLALTEPVLDEEAAVLFAPAWSQAEVLAAVSRADQSIVRFGGLANVGIVRLDTADAISALRREGAWLILPPGALGGCFLIGAQPVQSLSIPTIESRIT
jgi:hypothetical protein